MVTFDASIARAIRQCRPCTACCVYLPIPRGESGLGGKPAGIACSRRCATGCRAYAQRPGLCVNFRCAWLSDESWPAEWRPDRSGLMCLREEIEEGLPAAVVYEIYPGAIEGPTADEIMEELQQTTVVSAIVDVRNSRRRLLGKWDIRMAEPAVPASHPRQVAQAVGG